MSITTHEELIAKVPLFQGLSKRDLRRVSRHLRERTFQPGDDIVDEGRGSGAFFLITAGKAKVKVGNRTQATLKPGDYFGEMSIIDRKPRSATVEAETTVRTLSLTSTSLLGLLEDHFTISRRVMEALCDRIRKLQSSTSH